MDALRAAAVAAAVAGPAAAEERALDPAWGFVADTVMGGVSEGSVTHDGGAARLRGRVSLENDGGFIQMASDLDLDATGWTGIAFEARGNGETYELRLRTDDLARPWQSFRAPFAAGADWAEVRLPFDGFEAHRTDAALDLSAIRRVGVVAVGRAFAVDVAARGLRLYR